MEDLNDGLTNWQTACTTVWSGWRVPEGILPGIHDSGGDEPCFVNWHGLDMIMTVQQARDLRDGLSEFLAKVDAASDAKVEAALSGVEAADAR